MTVVFTDLETTGLSIFTDTVLEISAVVVDEQLNQMLGWYSRTIKVPENAAEGLRNLSDEYVREMHTKNGLWEDILRVGEQGVISPNDLCIDFYQWCQDFMPDPDATDPDLKLKLAGDSVDFDNDFLWVAHNPFWQFFNYRHWNLSSILAPIAEWNPLLFQEIRAYLDNPQAEEIHRGLPDCFSSWQKAIVLRRVITTPMLGNLEDSVPWSDFKGYQEAIENMMSLDKDRFLPVAPLFY